MLSLSDKKNYRRVILKNPTLSGALHMMTSELDKREYLMIIEGQFFLFLIETIVVTPHLNCLIMTVQMSGHNIHFLVNQQKLS